MNGNTITNTEYFGDEKVVNVTSLDKECDYEVMPGLFRRVLITQTGPGSYKWLVRNKEGTQKEDIDITYSDEGVFLVSIFFI